VIAASYDTQFLSFDATSIKIQISRLFHLFRHWFGSKPGSGIGTGKVVGTVHSLVAALKLKFYTHLLVR
jgi:hypothetical protein